MLKYGSLVSHLVVHLGVWLLWILRKYLELLINIIVLVCLELVMIHLLLLSLSNWNKDLELFIMLILHHIFHHNFQFHMLISLIKFGTMKLCLLLKYVELKISHVLNLSSLINGQQKITILNLTWNYQDFPLTLKLLDSFIE